MFSKKTVEKPALQALIDDVARQMLPLEATDPDFAKMNEQMKVLCASQSLKKEDSRVSADTKLAVAGNLLGIVLILAYEHAHPIVSKALNFVIRPRT